jgi:hypothetical protein
VHKVALVADTHVKAPAPQALQEVVKVKRPFNKQAGKQAEVDETQLTQAVVLTAYPIEHVKGLA